MPLDDKEVRELFERIATVETLITSHERNAGDREIAREKKFDVIFQKLSDRDCTLHAARMIELNNELTEHKDIIEKIDTRLSGIEKTVYVGLGVIGACTFIIPIAIKLIWG